MAFVSVKGLPGQVFVFDSKRSTRKKYKCPDCDICQMCGENRCRVCIKARNCRRRKRQGS